MFLMFMNYQYRLTSSVHRPAPSSQPLSSEHKILLPIMPYIKFFITSSLLSVAALAAPQIINDPVLFCPLVDTSVEVAGTAWQIGLSVPGGDSTYTILV